MLLIAWLVATLAVPVVAWRVLFLRMRGGRISSLRACGLLGLASLSPTMLYLGVFFAMVGVEEFTGAVLISEGIGRSLLFVLAFGLLVGLCAAVSFAIAVRRTNS